MLGLNFCAQAFSSCGERGSLFIAVRGPLTVAASLVAEHRLQTRRLSSCGSRTLLLRGMWDLPRPGLEPVSPALAGRLSTTAPPGKPGRQILNHCATRKIPSLAGFKTNKIKYVLTIQPSDCTLGHLSQRDENICMNISNNFIHDGPKLETIPMSFNRLMVKPSVVHPYYGLLLSTKKEWTLDKCNTDDLKRITPILKGYVLYDLIYKTFLKWHSYRDGEEISDCQGLRQGGEKDREKKRWVWLWKGSMRDPRRDETVLYLEMVMVTWIYTRDNIL